MMLAVLCWLRAKVVIAFSSDSSFWALVLPTALPRNSFWTLVNSSTVSTWRAVTPALIWELSSVSAFSWSSRSRATASSNDIFGGLGTDGFRPLEAVFGAKSTSGSLAGLAVTLNVGEQRAQVLDALVLEWFKGGREVFRAGTDQKKSAICDHLGSATARVLFPVWFPQNRVKSVLIFVSFPPRAWRAPAW